MRGKFCFPYRKLSNDLVELVPFSVPQHAQALYDLTSQHPEVWAHYPQGPYQSYQSFLKSFVNEFIAESRRTLSFAVIDKKSNTLAGVTAFMEADSTCRSITIGLFLISPPYRESHVPANAIFLMLQYALDAAFDWDSGLGLLRVQWRLQSLNTYPLHVAKMMPFKYEGTTKWARMVRDGVARGKLGNRNHTVLWLA